MDLNGCSDASFWPNGANNAYNGQSTTVNNNNKYNDYAVVPFAKDVEFQFSQFFDSFMKAYRLCCKKKKRTTSYNSFSLSGTKQLYRTAKAIWEHKYTLSPCSIYVIDYPSIREIVAPAFIDRIVLTWVYMRLNPLIDKILIDTVYNCRVGKGTLYGFKDLSANVKKISDDFTKHTVAEELDVYNFYMSIDKNILSEKIQKFIDDNYFRKDKYLLKEVVDILVFQDVKKNAVLRSKPELYDLVPRHKSILHNDGFAPGSLTNQMFANFYMNDVDLAVSTEVEFYCRYMDDMRFLDNDEEKIVIAKKKLQNELSKCKLLLHPKKHNRQIVQKGVHFVGGTVMPHRNYVNNRIIKRIYQQCNEFMSIPLWLRLKYIKRFESSLNSYVGNMCHFDSYNIRWKVFSKVNKICNPYKFYTNKGMEYFKMTKQSRRLLRSCS